MFKTQRCINCRINTVTRAGVLAVALLLSPVLSGYSVLSHEAIVDSAWDAGIRPLLIKRYPAASTGDLLQAHAYAYGGCIIQDMGYYPFGSKFFSDLLHYVRSGDYILSQLSEARDLNEYAFALGSLAHYAADNAGHSIAVNPSVALEYPKLEREYGPKVTFAENPQAHLKVEFGFDVLQVAHGNYAPQSYHDFIGFQVAKPLMERAFRDTYGLELNDVFVSVDLALGTYRRAVSTFIPEMTRVAWDLDKNELRKAQGVTRKKFIYNLSRASYEKEWDTRYKKPGIGARILAFFFRIIPKVGPFKTVAFKPPTPETSKLFQDSFDKTLDVYRKLLNDAGGGQLRLVNTNFDTGAPEMPATYSLADDAYANLAIKLAAKDQADAKMRQDVLAYFGDLRLPFATKKHRKEWRRTLRALDRLRAQATPKTTGQ